MTPAEVRALSLEEYGAMTEYAQAWIAAQAPRG
jgi:hypothetical protein